METDARTVELLIINQVMSSELSVRLPSQMNKRRTVSIIYNMTFKQDMTSVTEIQINLEDIHKNISTFKIDTFYFHYFSFSSQEIPLKVISN